MNRPIKIGSLFAGIGGFELGLERAIPGAETVWQVEQNQFCQKILKKHWPNAKIFDDVRTVNKNNLEPVDIICGGFPCQDISNLGSGKGLSGEKSGLWVEMQRLISELRPRIAVLENVPAIIIRGLPDILRGLSEIGYDAEWQIISARQFGAPHLRKRWFCVAYPAGVRQQRQRADWVEKLRIHAETTEIISSDTGKIWSKREIKPVLCGMDAGLSPGLHRTNRIKALGNAIVPQCSEYIGQHILKSGLLNDLS